MTSFFTKASEFLFAISLLCKMMLVNTAVKTGDVEFDTADKPDWGSFASTCTFLAKQLSAAGCLS